MRYFLFLIMGGVLFMVPTQAEAFGGGIIDTRGTVFECLDAPPFSLIGCAVNGISEKSKRGINYTGPRYKSQINAYKRRGSSTSLELKKPPRTIRDKRVK